MLSAISWGVMIPLGIMIARYMKRIAALRKKWVKLHRACQLVAYAIGFVGWAIGICLRITSKGVHYNAHLNIGIGIIFLATFQVVFGFLRPKGKNKYKKYWNMAHYVIGWSVLFLGIINVFEGLAILRPPKQWKVAYTCILAVLVSVSLISEAIFREIERN
ncbi:unnamed protein product [Cuscuta europaea]|uniref:Cytochrome b561 domain-containing protein n=1 Tax=Cuscuta europaea TaxID=41803 RepID=A0A9P1E297_CUSEU|nr:unnamed protein product [Cuscuta europaea]